MEHNRSRPAGRILALDPGRTRTGIALSDPEGYLASPLETVTYRSGRLVDHVLRLIALHEVVVVVIGLPYLPSGDEGEIAAISRGLAEHIRRRAGVNVVLRDETLTSWEAQSLISGAGRHRQDAGRRQGDSRRQQGPGRHQQRAGQRRRRAGEVDRLAATLILQDYLDELRRNQDRPCEGAGGGPDASARPEA